ncbi:Unknown protein sequence [Pseudomonas savastanoi pv. phaseolicola]|nr:Unknown protein sequence [Pseudomonas savastanoi pv. phaseolicola]KPB67584.1 Unknown protein sequence [Pseudomonas amygdali pv. mellea]
MVFALIKRVVSKLEQLGGIVCSGRKRSEAQSCANLDGHVRQLEAFMHQFTQVFTKRQQCIVADITLDNHSELVTAQSRHMHCIAGGTGQTFGYQHQQTVAGTMPIKVIDWLEPVQIQHADRQPGALRQRLLHGRVQCLKELSAVRQPRQTVLIGQQKVLIAQLLGSYLHIHQAGEIAVLILKNDQHANRHQHDVHCCGDESNVVRRREKNNKRSVDHNCSGQRRRPQVHHAEDADNHGDAHEKRHVRLGIGIAIGIKRQRPGGETGSDHACQSVGPAQRRQNGGWRGWRPVYREQPLARTNSANNSEQRRNQQGQPHRSSCPMGECQRPGVDQQHEIHQWQLSGQRNVLGLQQPGIISGYRHHGAQGTH